MTEVIAAAFPGLAASLFDNSLGADPLALCANTLSFKVVDICIRLGRISDGNLRFDPP